MSRSAVRVRAWAVGSAAMCVVVLAGCSSEEPVALPSATTVSVATTTESAEDLAFKEAEAAYRAHIALLNELARSPGDEQLLGQLGDTSTGIDKSTWETWYGKVWIDRGWRWQKGEIVVRQVRLLRSQLNLKPPQMKIRTCDDASSALVVDRKGRPVRNSDDNAVSATSTTMIQGNDGAWRVSRSTNKLVSAC